MSCAPPTAGDNCYPMPPLSETSIHWNAPPFFGYGTSFHFGFPLNLCGTAIDTWQLRWGGINTNQCHTFEEFKMIENCSNKKVLQSSRQLEWSLCIIAVTWTDLTPKFWAILCWCYGNHDAEWTKTMSQFSRMSCNLYMCLSLCSQGCAIVSKPSSLRTLARVLQVHLHKRGLALSGSGLHQASYIIRKPTTLWTNSTNRRGVSLDSCYVQKPYSTRSKDLIRELPNHPCPSISCAWKPSMKRAPNNLNFKRLKVPSRFLSNWMKVSRNSFKSSSFNCWAMRVNATFFILGMAGDGRAWPGFGWGCSWCPFSTK